MTRFPSPSALLAAMLVLTLSSAAAQEEPDLVGRTKLLTEIETALDDGSLESAESLLAEFRSRYPASSRVRGWENGNEVIYLYDAVTQLGDAYAEQRDFAKVLQIYEEELAGLTIEVPHYSWRLLALAVPYQLETGVATRHEIRSRLDEYRSRFARMQDKVESSGRKSLFKSLVDRMDGAVRHLDLIGEQAPDFTFLEAFNAKAMPTLDSLRGKVVLLDFWATWCAPCMAAWPTLGALYERCKDRGFEMLGVTSLQGRFGEHEDLTRQREVELTRDFILQQDADWPILFSDRSVYDPEYGVATLPSYVIVDRDGRVAGILVGHFGAIGEVMVERLLAAD